MSGYRKLLLATTAALCGLGVSTSAQNAQFSPVTEEEMLNPDPADWLMINRTYDEQRFSPLDQINRDNVGDLRMAWSRGLPRGSQETTPIVHDGVMYLVQPGAGLLAINAATGDQIWEYWRDIPRAAQEFVGAPETSRTKNIAIYSDMIYYPTPDGYLVALGATDGEVRWEAKVFETDGMAEHTGGVLIADGKVITNRTCEQQTGCFISAHDAMTGEEVWKFWNTGEPGSEAGDSWGDVPLEGRIASSWGLPGSYDPERGITYWGISNPKPYTRLSRHGSAEAVPQVAPADLFSNSTVAINVETGELEWYYQHLPGDDWDADHLHERTLFTTTFNPDPNSVKWINPNIERGEQRDAVAEQREVHADEIVVHHDDEHGEEPERVDLRQVRIGAAFWDVGHGTVGPVCVTSSRRGQSLPARMARQPRGETPPPAVPTSSRHPCDVR